MSGDETKKAHTVWLSFDPVMSALAMRLKDVVRPFVWARLIAFDSRMTGHPEVDEGIPNLEGPYNVGWLMMEFDRLYREKYPDSSKRVSLTAVGDAPVGDDLGLGGTNSRWVAAAGTEGASHDEDGVRCEGDYMAQALAFAILEVASR